MRRLPLVPVLVAGVLLAAGHREARAISVSSFGAPLTEDFNVLPNFGTSSLLPSGWFLSESGSNANNLYTAGNGSSNAGDTYSFGDAASTDRALGSIRATLLIPVFGAMFTNDVANGVIESIAIAYRGEEWRLGTSDRTDQLDFQYSLDATSLTTGTWTDANVLDFVTPNSFGNPGARNGNLVSTSIAATLFGLSIPHGASFWIRWMDADASGADDGLAVDDFSLTAQGTIVPEPSSALLLGVGCVGISRWRRGHAERRTPQS
jgi:hypothetical protein